MSTTQGEAPSQATNAVYMGRATPRTVKLLPNGVVLNERMAQKVRRQEQGHEYAERLGLGVTHHVSHQLSLSARELHQ
ncbi:hypothetical protein ACFQ9Z_37155 [Streptomyces sp. NPDC056580]|uniref:hypothetical protein n=1 Tax=Streptomyces sp. NPDC056580 TaxID=3345872 RepID=UPI0036986EC0